MTDKVEPYPAPIRHGKVVVVKEGEPMSVSIEDGSGAIRVKAPEDGVVVDDGHTSVFVSAADLNQAMIDHGAPKLPAPPVSESIDLAGEESYYQCEEDAVYRCGCETATTFKSYTRRKYVAWEKWFSDHIKEKGLPAYVVNGHGEPVPLDWPDGWRNGICSECGQLITMVRSEADE